MSKRLDHALVAANLADSRARAQALVKAGVVLVDGTPARKASQTIPPGSQLTLTENPCPWVSRAALKLEHALDLWGLKPGGEALDVGASTGGFTEVLLARGATMVHAVDVGHGQLHQRLASDRRVQNLEGLNAKDIPHDLIPPLDWIVSDVSFISLEKALPVPLSLAKP
ncbi:MAG: TlyA family RNA methyltransferase, partial [Pikeienuella sp.]